MIIEKNGKVYMVTELHDKWSVDTDSGKLSITFSVSKDLCPTVDELRKYIMNNNEMF